LLICLSKARQTNRILTMSSNEMLVGNELSEEEKGWMKALEEAARAEGVKWDSRFMLASFAIVTKGDVKKGLKRMKNWNKVSEQYDFKNVSEAEGTKWMQENMGQFMVCVGTDKTGYNGYGVHLGSFQPSVVKTDYDEKCIIRAVADNMRSNTPTLAHVRRGNFMFADMKGYGWANLSLSLDKKISSVYQDSYPIKVKRIFMVNPPSFLFALMELAKVFIKKKLLERVAPVRPEGLAEYFEGDQIPAYLGGGFTQDFWQRREDSIKIHRASVAEVESGSGPRAATVSL